MKRARQTVIPEDFALTARTLAWLAAKHPNVDIVETLELFIIKAEAKGWMYANWQRAFQNYVADTGPRFGGVVYLKQEHSRIDKVVFERATQHGFREPYSHETTGSYRTAFEQWQSAPKRALNVVDMLDLLKRA